MTANEALVDQESFICMQEVLHNQLIDIQTGLGSEWSYIGVGRDDGKEAGEYSPIFYRKGIWEVEKWRTVWLSETPDVPGKGWVSIPKRGSTVLPAFLNWLFAALAEHGLRIHD
jgi:hypothetical protein